MTETRTLPAWLPDKLVKHDEPAWLSDSRAKHWAAFVAQGLPTKKNERFKYAELNDIKAQSFMPANINEVPAEIINAHLLPEAHLLILMINGHYVAAYTDNKKIPAGMIICDLNEAVKKHAALVEKYWRPTWQTKDYPFASINTALFSHGLFFYLPKNCKMDLPIHLLSISVNENTYSQPHALFVADEGSECTLLEEYAGFDANAYLMNSVMQIELQKEAHITHYKIQNESPTASHLAHYFIQQAESSCYAMTNFSFGSAFARDEVNVTLLKPQAICRTAGLYCLRQDQQYIDHHIDIHHVGECTESEMLYKGIVDKKSRAVFNGKLEVAKGAQKINAYQANHHLLLSKHAEIYTKPELVIHADDVKCKHGATTGQLDQDALFYLRARGIEKADAIAMLMQGFAEEIMAKVSHAGIKKRVRTFYEK